MVAIQIRDVPDAVRDALAGEAERRGVSLQSFLADVLEREAASARNLAWLRSVAERQRPQASSSPTRDDIRDGWLERDRRIAEAVGYESIGG
ncbi:MAG TPA: hypothetical protein VNS80_05175 [Pseudolysinimonas sp.]|nr:hypothetical protein [Pseudolysinimonas sp.]